MPPEKTFDTMEGEIETELRKEEIDETRLYYFGMSFI